MAFTLAWELQCVTVMLINESLGHLMHINEHVTNLISTIDSDSAGDEEMTEESLIGDQGMIGDEGAIDAFYPRDDEPFNVTLDKRLLPLVRRRATHGRARLTTRRSVWHERPVRHHHADVNVIFLAKRQGQTTCGLDKNYYKDVCTDIPIIFGKR